MRRKILEISAQSSACGENIGSSNSLEGSTLLLSALSAVIRLGFSDVGTAVGVVGVVGLNDGFQMGMMSAEASEDLVVSNSSVRADGPVLSLDSGFIGEGSGADVLADVLSVSSASVVLVADEAGSESDLLGSSSASTSIILLNEVVVALLALLASFALCASRSAGNDVDVDVLDSPVSSVEV